METADRLFAEIAGGVHWGLRRRRMYDRVVDEPRLTWGWRTAWPGTGTGSPVEIDRPVVALLSLGEPRRFLLGPHGGGMSQALMLGSGDLLVTGGQTQRRFDHSVPKVARAGPRMSVAFRHGVRIYPG